VGEENARTQGVEGIEKERKSGVLSGGGYSSHSFEYKETERTTDSHNSIDSKGKKAVKSHGVAWDFLGKARRDHHSLRHPERGYNEDWIVQLAFFPGILSSL